MSRPLRLEYPDVFYHVMNHWLARQATFRTPTDYETFLQVLHETHTLCGVEVLASCLMPNNYHLCLITPAGNLGRIMRHLNDDHSSGKVF
jgi:REP element-mobilizing transposase RayT